MLDEYEFDLFATKLDEEASKEAIKDTFYKCSDGQDSLNEEQLGKAINIILTNAQ